MLRELKKAEQRSLRDIQRRVRIILPRAMRRLPGPREGDGLANGRDGEVTVSPGTVGPPGPLEPAMGGLFERISEVKLYRGGKPVGLTECRQVYVLVSARAYGSPQDVVQCLAVHGRAV